MVSALFILVVLAVLGAAIVSVSVNQSLGSASEVNASRAYQAARAGAEWGMYSVMRTATPCAATNPAITFTSDELKAFTVTVTCTTTGPFIDGATSLTYVVIEATACNAPASGVCPGVVSETYVERRLTWTVAR